MTSASHEQRTSVSPRRSKPDALALHTQTEDDVLSPAALVVGDKPRRDATVSAGTR